METIEPNYKIIKKGQILIDKTLTRYKLTNISKNGVPGAWACTIKDIDTNYQRIRPLIDIERYYKILIDEKNLESIIKKGMKSKDLFRIFKRDVTCNEWVWLLGLKEDQIIGKYRVGMHSKYDQIEHIDLWQIK